MQIDRAWIEAHIPHRGRMCLLDEVIDWGADRISCRSFTHQAGDHPMRAHEQLGVVCGIEYAAQTMAVHGALTAAPGDGPAAGLLAGLRSIQFYALRLDDVTGPLICNATRVAGDAATALYAFEVRSAKACLLDGRATVIFDAKGRADL